MRHAIDLSRSPLTQQSSPTTLDERLALALAGSNQIAFDWHIADDKLHFNGEVEGTLKGTRIDVSRVWKSSDLIALMHDDDQPQFRARLREALKGHERIESTFYQVEVRLKDAAHGWRWIRIAGKIVERDEGRRATRMVGTFLDIDERKRRENELANREKFKSAILTAAIDCIVTMNDRGEIMTFNGAAEQAFGLLEQDVIGTELRNFLLLPHGDIDTDIPLNQHVELHAMRVDGSLFPIELAMVELPAQEQRVMAVFIRDISDRKRAEEIQRGQNRILDMVANGVSLLEILLEIRRLAEALSNAGSCSILLLDTALAEDSSTRLQMEKARCCLSRPIVGKDATLLGTFMLRVAEPDSFAEQLADTFAYLAGVAVQSRMSEDRIRYLAHYDGLTGLPNRFLFKEYFDLALKSAKRHGKKFAVCFVDLDKFKDINDTLGHDAGDEVLRVIARRMRSVLRHTDKIARMGGDEFYVLIEDLNDGFHAAEVAGKLLEEACRPVCVGGIECRLSASIGISIYPDDGCDEQSLLQRADSAMYKAKESGKNAYRFFSAEADRTRVTTAMAVQHALLTAGLRYPSRDREFAIRG
jgi:diguanylate cyclase (GGDEF)-like protein/PAS domain S-box-containing protein